ncbi:MAG: zinc ABC transporter substrate-binding protein [Actinobacteria bacterium]|nr:zinc ABC transporter substrate-binding protein [Actinomycetota bacterium]
MPHARPRRLAAVVIAAALLVSACGGGGGSAGRIGPGRGFLVVAAENFWGSIAAQLGGTRADVASVIVDPGTDPHSYLPTAGDSRLLAQSRMAIVNGIGYDAWASQALAANPDGRRAVLDVGKVLGLGQGANPHQWYSPAGVRRVADAITAAYARLDPAGAGYFARRREAFLRGGLAGYEGLRAAIRRRFAGVPVGYSESIFAPLGTDLGLRLATPPSFARAIAEGVDVTAEDKLTVDRQAQTRQIRAWVYNRQNVTPDVRRVNALVRAAGIPIAAITETLDPAGASFEQWQVRQLGALAAALHRSTGR